jgi:hypothetical protein
VQQVLDATATEVSRLAPEDRRQAVARTQWGPPPWVIATWVNELPVEQIVKDVERYRVQGRFDVIDVKRHDSYFQKFMKNSLTFNAKKHQRYLVAQRAEYDAKQAMNQMNNNFYDNYDWDNFGISPETFRADCERRRRELAEKNKPTEMQLKIARIKEKLRQEAIAKAAAQKESAVA